MAQLLIPSILPLNNTFTGSNTFALPATFSGDNAIVAASGVGYVQHSNASGLVLCGHGSSNDITFVNNTGANVFRVVAGTTTVRFYGTVEPSTSDSAVLGSTSRMWSDAFFASGGVLNWNNGDFTATHSTGNLTFSGTITMTTAKQIVSTGSIYNYLDINNASGNAILSSRGSVFLDVDADNNSTSNVLYVRFNSTNYTAIFEEDGAFTLGTTAKSGSYALYAGEGTFTSTLSVNSGTTTGHGLFVQADSLTAGSGIYLYSNSSSNTSRYLGYIVNDHASATGTTALYVRNDSTNAVATFIGGATTNPALYVGADSLTTGRGIQVASNSSSTSQFVLLDLTSSNASATGMIPLAISNAAPTSTNYFRMMYLGGNSGGNYLWKANGVTPAGNLSGAVGDICIGADGGKMYYCTGTTSWTAM